MSRLPSAETRLKSLRREHKLTSDALAAARRELTVYRGRAGKAETEAAEWKKRFDLLLARAPTADPKP